MSEYIESNEVCNNPANVRNVGCNIGRNRGIADIFGGNNTTLLFFFLLLVIIFFNCSIFNEHGDELLFFFLLLVILFGGNRFFRC